ncbi:MAG: hypothetical protein WBH84_07130 [Defluviitoga tunisiensis]|jgi:hypothetical protein|nr:hypothetical protein [Defluviitoga tunisiensis]HOB54853.1 hypothetical protein [Defluviitoga tunisiensis]HOP33622.1 hypothetical protein [Defluviitoga tunisiensis]HPU59356.1 hypothetical protein [Defluviitoga tunisiensis]HPZ66447.1 hypothetical protein [Defluviitoga tunisiensis]
MNEKNEQMWLDYLDGLLKENQLNDYCKKLANLYYRLINCYFSCESNTVEKVKHKLVSQKYGR